MRKKVFLSIKISLVVIAFFLHANDQRNEFWLVLGSFWMVTGIEGAIRDFQEGSKLSLGFNLVFIAATTILLTIGIVIHY
ncbi:hypothetical protein V6B33_02335 [Mangrovibacillus sp. Mu-81]|uniref:hypothetical protein n=1 Tax=Mangrovibacillus sp. Mu-81 TaxID=3121478 RepID=UPI002FE4E0C5